MRRVQLMTYNPGHFHAALVQKDMSPGLDPRVHVYAPLSQDLLLHLQRILGFNSRKDNPTAWETEVHAGPDALARMLAEKPGNVVVLAGFNRTKIDAIKAAVEAGLHVLSDKPWIIEPEDMPKLESALKTAESKGVIAYDIMTERYEITSLLQAALVNDPEICGELVPGTPDEPCVFMESRHYLSKSVAGVPLRRPPWYFDSRQQGEGLSDVGTHLVDLVFWMLFPGQAIDRKDTAIVASKRWPTIMTVADYQKVTGDAQFPAYVAEDVKDGKLHYYCNTLVNYTVRGHHVKLNVLWDYETTTGSGDTHFAVVRGSKARVEVRQGPEQKWRPELYVVPLGKGFDAVAAAVKERMAALQGQYPGIGAQPQGGDIHITIPDSYRIGHEAHFGEVARQFLRYLEHPGEMPAWETPNMLAKYHITTAGVAESRRSEKLP